MNPMKKSLVLFLSLLLLLSIFPLGVFATEEVDSIDTGQEEVITEETVEEQANNEEPTPTPEAAGKTAAVSLATEVITPVEEQEESAVTYTKDEVQALIDALPTMEEISDWPIELQKSSYDHFVEVTDAFYSLSFEEQEQIDMTRMIDLSVFYNSATSMAATLYYQDTWHQELFSYSIKGSWYDNTGAYRSFLLDRINCHWIYDTSSGNPCYCIRADLGEAEYYYYYSSGSGMNAWSKQLTEAQRSLIRLILLYGYPNCVNTNGHIHKSSHCQAATQVLIHEAVTKCLSSTAPYKHNNSVFSDAIPYDSTEDSWYNVYWDFLSRIQNEGWLPSWIYNTQEEADAAPVMMTFNEDSGLYEATVVNTSKKNTGAQWYSIMTDEFSYDLPEGVTITRDKSIGNTAVGQTITITATPEAMANSEIKVPVTTPYMVHTSEKSSYPATVWVYARYSESWSN